MSKQVPLTMPSNSRLHNQNRAYHSITNRSDNDQKLTGKQGRAGRRGQGRGRSYRGQNNPLVHTKRQRDQESGSYYQHVHQQYQQPPNTYPRPERRPLAFQEQVFQQHQQACSFLGHYRQLLVEQQRQQRFEYEKYHHRRSSSRHYNLSAEQQQQLEYETYQQQTYGFVQGGLVHAHHDNIYAEKLYVQPQSYIREIHVGVFEITMPNGSVEYRYPPVPLAPVQLRGDAAEFVPSEATWAKAVHAAQTTTAHSREKEFQEKKKEGGENNDVAILTELPNVVLEAAEVGRATSVGGDDAVDEDGAVDVDILDDPAGFVVKKLSRKGSSGLLMRLNVERTEGGL